MPYIIKEVSEGQQTGYKVCKRDQPEKCFSKSPLPKERAQKQRTAIILSEMGISQKKPAAASAAPGKKRSETVGRKQKK